MMIDVAVSYLSLRRSVRVQKRYLKRYIHPELYPYAMTFNIDSKAISKINRYYGMGVPAVLGLLFCLPRGKVLTLTERKGMTYLGALTGIIDDAFDEQFIHTQRIWEYTRRPEAFVASTANEYLLAFVGSKVLECLPYRHRDAFFDTAYKVLQLQQESLAQLDTDIPLGDLKRITRDKGGWPLILYRYCIDAEVSAEEIELLFELGAIMQLGNDIFDVYKDHKIGLRTLANVQQDINSTQTILEQWMRAAVDKCRAVSFARLKDKKHFMNCYLLGMSRCFVCLDQYRQLQSGTSDTFIPQAYTRSALICDMEKPHNIWGSLLWFRNLKRMFKL